MTSSPKLQQAVIQAFEKVPDLYLILSPELQILAASDAYLTATHTIREEITGKSISQMLSDSPIGMSAEALQRLACSLQQVLCTRQPHQPELPQCHETETPYSRGCAKEYRTMLNTPVLDDKGEVLYIIHKLEDATEKMKTVPEPLQSRQLLQTTIDSSLDMIQVFEAVRDENGEIIDFRWILNNRASEEIYGDVVGRSLLGNNPGVAKAGIFDTFKSVVETGIPDQTERHYVYEQFDGWFYQSTVKLGDGVATTTRDITKRKKAEQQLKESKALFKSVLNNTASSIMLLKPIRNAENVISDFQYTYTNDQTLKSVSRSSLEGKFFTKEFPGVVNSDLFNHYVHVFETGEQFQGQVDISAFGFPVWTQVYAQKLDDALLVTYFDITDRKMAEQELRTTKEFLQATLDTTLQVVQSFKAVRDEAGKIIDFVWIYTNRMWKKQHGDEMVGKRLLEENPGVIESGLFEKFIEVTETGVPMEHEQHYGFEQFDGWFYQTLAKLGDGFVMSTVDITELKRNEQEILRLKDEVAQRATDKYYSLFNSIDEGFCIMELLYNEDGKITDLVFQESNASFNKHTSLGAVAGKKVSELLPNLEQHWINVYERVAETGQAQHYENYAQDVDRWFGTNFFRIGGPGSHLVAVAFTDITDRIKAEKALRESDERKAFLLKMSDALRPLNDALAIEETVTRLAMEYFGSDRCYYCQIEGDQSIITRDAAREGLPSVAGVYHMSAIPIFKAVVDSGKPFIVHDVYHSHLVDEALRQHCIQLQVISFMDIPVIKNGIPVGILCVVQSEPREWTALEIELAEETAERTWTGVERAKAEESLRKSEEKYRSIFETIDEGFAIQELLTDADGNVVDLIYQEVNEAYSQHSGLKDVLGKRASELFPQLEQHWLDCMTHVYKTGEPVRTEGYQADLNRWYTLQYARIGGPGSRCISVVFNHITEQKQREEHQTFLLKFSDKLRSEPDPDSVANCAIRLLIKQLQLDRCYITSYYLEDNRADLDYQIGNDTVPPLPDHFVLSDYPEAFKAIFDRTVVIEDEWERVGLSANEKRNSGNLGMRAMAAATLRKGEGKPLWSMVAISSRPRRWTAGEISLIEEVAERTWAALERAKSEQALRKSEARHRTLFDSVDEGICLFERVPLRQDGLRDYRYVAMNPTMQAMFGIPDLSGQSIRDNFPNEAEDWYDDYDHVLETGQPMRIERESSPQGMVLEMFVTRVDDVSGELLLAVMKDITERKRQEQRQAYLLKLNDTLRPLSNPIEVQRAATKVIGEYLDVDRAYYCDIEPDYEHWVVADNYVRPGVTPHISRGRIDDFGWAGEQLTAGKILCVSDVSTDPNLSESARSEFLSVNITATLCIPLMKEGHWVANLALQYQCPHVWSDAEIKLAQETAERTWAAVERSKAEEALRQSEKRFHSIANLVPDLLWDSEPDGSTNWYNQRWLEYTGQRLDQAIGWGWVDTIHPDDRKNSAKHYNEAVEAGRPLRQEHRIRRHDGLYRWFVISASPVKDESGNVVKMYGAATDIHDRKRMEEALRQSEEKYRTLFDSIDEGYCIIQMIYDDAGTAIDFRYLQVNEAFERNTDLQNAEGKTIRELAPDIEPKWIEIYDQVAHTGEPLRFEEASDALHHVFSLYAFRIGDPAEHKVAVIFTDITERKKSQEALRQSEEQFRLFVTASSDIIYRMNADWSRMQMLTGKDFLPDTQEPTDSWTDVYIPSEDRVLVEATIQQAIQSKKIFELEHRVNKADGTVGWVSSRAIPVLDEQGNIMEWFGTASDITLRKKAEQQLQNLNERLEQLVAERTHELNESKLFAEQITEATPDFIMIFNLISNKVEFVNQGPYAGNDDRFQETMQIDYDQLMQRAHPEDRQKLQAYIDMFRIASDQAAHTLEYRVIDKGKTTWYRTRGKVFKRDETGKPTHFISVVQDISDLKQLEQENLQMRLDQQRDNLLVILEAQEEERRRFSEALHNGVGQILYSAKLHLGQRLQKSGPSDPIRQVDKILDEAIRQTRGLSHQLTPALLEQFGLETAFEEMGNMLSTPSLQLQCLVYNLPKQLDKHLQLVVYRVAQEMANNIIRHSNATEASLLLRTHRQNIVLIAEDNGRGFDLSSTRKKGIGLSSIKNRVELLNGSFSINTAPGQGTQVKITLPL